MNCGFTEQNADVTFVHYQKVSCKTAVDNKRHFTVHPVTRTLQSAGPTDTVFLHVAIGGTSLRVSSPIAVFAPNIPDR